MGKQTEKEKAMIESEVNPLRNEEVYVRFVPQPTGFGIESKSHVGYGGLFDGNAVTLCVPILGNGRYKNVLTNEEKDFLERALGLDSNALSVYKSENNFWDNYKIRIDKEGLKLNLSDPNDYIRYKVLLANNTVVAPSVKERMERPKATYRFEIVKIGEEASIESAKMDATMESYMEFGKIDKDLDTMRVLVELLDGRPYSPKETAVFFKSRINLLIQADAKRFLQYIKDPMLHTKVIIKRAVELGKVSMKNDYYYLASDGSPLCEVNEKSTLSVAARYLNQPAHQEIKFLLESEVDIKWFCAQLPAVEKNELCLTGALSSGGI